MDYYVYIKKTELNLSSFSAYFCMYAGRLQKKPLISSSVHPNDVTSTTDIVSANLFSINFALVCNPPLPPPMSNVLQHSLNNLLFYVYLLPNDTLHTFSKLKNNNSSGSNGISANLLYNCCYSLIYPLFFLFRRFMNEGIFLSVWKIGSFTSILK